MNYDDLTTLCYDYLHLVSLEHGWDLAIADQLRTAMLAQPEPVIPPTVTSLDIFNALAPSMHAGNSDSNDCVASFRSISLDDLDRVIKALIA